MSAAADKLAELQRAYAAANAAVANWRYTRWGPTFREAMSDRAKAAQALRDYCRENGLEFPECVEVADATAGSKP